jgi:hypothetical protein
MRKSLHVPSTSNIKVLSVPRSEASQILRDKDYQAGQVLVQQSLHQMHAAIRAVKEALPDTDPELIGGFFADLLDLWETGQKLDKELHKLTELRFPQDRERLRDILIWISASQIDMASYWIGEIKKDLPKLLRALDSKSLSTKQKRKPVITRSVRGRKVAKI